MSETVKVGRFLTANRVPCDPHDVWTIEARDGATLGIIDTKAKEGGR